MVRETPLHKGRIDLMSRCTDLGAVTTLPPEFRPFTTAPRPSRAPTRPVTRKNNASLAFHLPVPAVQPRWKMLRLLAHAGPRARPGDKIVQNQHPGNICGLPRSRCQCKLTFLPPDLRVRGGTIAAPRWDLPVWRLRCQPKGSAQNRAIFFHCSGLRFL